MSETFQAGEAANQLTPAYAYIVDLVDAGQKLFLTGWQKPFSMTGIPAVWGAADPQAFSLAQISHGEHGLSAEFEGKPLTINVTTQNTALAQYFSTASAALINVAIFRLNTQKLLLDGQTLQYGVDSILLNSGRMGNISFNKQAISAEIMPLPFGANQSIPRYYYSKGCNHVLYEPNTCTVLAASFTQTVTIDAMQPSTRTVTISITAPGGDANYFRGGVLVHTATGQRAGVDACDAGGPGGKMRLRLKMWNLAFAPGDSVTVRAGCNRTLDECVAKFNNKDNFGGFPYGPNRNPALYGVGQ